MLILLGAMTLFAGMSLADEPAGSRKGRDLVLGPDDTVTIVLLDGEEISKLWRVGASGELTLPMVGRMQVSGMTVEQFERELAQRLRKYFRDPQVTVFVSEYRSQPVTVTGAVEKPGTSQLEGSRTLFEVLMRAGGPKDAGLSLTLTRAISRGRIPWPGAKDDSNGYSIATFDLTEVLDGRSEAANMLVQPYDVISVGEGKVKRLVHIIGEVVKPGAIELITQERVSIMKALAIAGGLTHTAASTKAHIMHIGPNGSHSELATVNLKMIMSGKAKDLELTAGDVIIVPSSQIKSTIQSMAMSAVSTGIYLGILTGL